MIPGEYLLAEADILALAGRQTVEVIVSNTGDRPVQVGSHYHFFEVNRALYFDRQLALGMRLNIPSGTAVRFEPGQAHTVELVALAGKGLVFGFNRLVEGSVRTQHGRKQALLRLQEFLEIAG
ncbi:urease subunit beta [Anthocerotibacter panamensis]|uniref:urease subunit beta n=1 Tax=Anthocerotibacter panamensis TaxID=2857077 RepID=UPI001C406682|nr:urease subunit beta [Anthocerotibacter panamensis]